MENNIEKHYQIIEEKTGYTKENLQYPESLTFEADEIAEITTNTELSKKDAIVNTFAHNDENIMVHLLADVVNNEAFAILVQDNETGAITQEIVL